MGCSGTQAQPVMIQAETVGRAVIAGRVASIW
ncbi:hypothetical protein LWM68_27770 [Niabella sp. W65]|nr:hypothetical protein [Niabella sp. W65]MCH7366234.1 hypothetical protein [Niabella sp. W65]